MQKLKFNYIGRSYDTIIVDRMATWAEFCEHKPNSIRLVKTDSGREVYVHKSANKSKQRYYRCHCTACGRVYIVRADVLRRWVKDEKPHQCKCSHTHMPKDYGPLKTCKHCGQGKPATTEFFYQSKSGYFASNCKTCAKIIRVDKKKLGK